MSKTFIDIPRLEHVYRPIDERVSDCSEVEMALPTDEIQQLAKRCQNCGLSPNMEQDLKYRQRSLALPQDEGLYHFSNEHDACGVGLVANLSGQSTHDIVIKGLTILRRLLHRGAAGSDALSGDGAGLLCVIPHDFFQHELN